MGRWRFPSHRYPGQTATRQAATTATSTTSPGWTAIWKTTPNTPSSANTRPTSAGGKVRTSIAGSYDLTNPQSFNRYTYALNDPANLVDPSGLDTTQTVACGADAQGNPVLHDYGKRSFPTWQLVRRLRWGNRGLHSLALLDVPGPAHNLQDRNLRVGAAVAAVDQIPKPQIKRAVLQAVSGQQFRRLSGATR